MTEALIVLVAFALGVLVGRRRTPSADWARQVLTATRVAVTVGETRKIRLGRYLTRIGEEWLEVTALIRSSLVYADPDRQMQVAMALEGFVGILNESREIVDAIVESDAELRVRYDGILKELT